MFFGFTLIELIVVIAIIAILAAIAIPRFSGFRAKATTAADQQYGALIGNAIAVAMAEGKVTVGGDIDVVNAGTVVIADVTATNLTGLTAAMVTDLVATKKLAKASGGINVAVTIDGVVTVTP